VRHCWEGGTGLAWLGKEQIALYIVLRPTWLSCTILYMSHRVALDSKTGLRHQSAIASSRLRERPRVLHPTMSVETRESCVQRCGSVPCESLETFGRDHRRPKQQKRSTSFNQEEPAIMSTLALPGQTLGPSSANNPGSGTHIQSSHIYSSLAGTLTQPSKTKSAPQPTLSVARSAGPLVPSTGTVVLGRITRLNARQANLSILALGASGEHTCRDAFPGIIRQQDIRATEIDKVKVHESFRVGDVVRAVVISLGDERSYFCSTARNELGVVMAVSEAGNQMVPVSWREFLDERVGVKEARKVAKPV